MVKEIIFYIFIFIAFCYIMGMIFNISQYFKNKTSNITIKQQIELEKHSRELYTHNLLDRIDATVSIMNLMNIIIDNEISKTLQGCIRLNTKYELSKLDKDVKTIATTVYDCFKKDIFDSTETIVTSNFLMQHITDEVMLRLIKAVQEYNTVLRQN